jgi:hypothetical protein
MENLVSECKQTYLVVLLNRQNVSQASQIPDPNLLYSKWHLEKDLHNDQSVHYFDFLIHTILVEALVEGFDLKKKRALVVTIRCMSEYHVLLAL